MTAFYHGSTGLVGREFEAGTWCTTDIIEAIYYARCRGGSMVYVFAGAEHMKKRRKYYRLTAPRPPDECLEVVGHPPLPPSRTRSVKRSYKGAWYGLFFVATSFNHNRFIAMKRLFLLLCFLGAVAASASAQRFFDVYDVNDTLTDQDEIIYQTNHNGGPLLIDVPYYFSVQVEADSLSGANAGTIVLEFTNDRTATKWYTMSAYPELTIDGTTTSKTAWEGIVYARRVRIRAYTPSGTRTVGLRVYGSFKRM